MRKLPWASILTGVLVLIGMGATPPSSPVLPRGPRHVLIGTYNVQHFGRADLDLKSLSAVIAQFDVCAIEEVQDEGALIVLTKALSKKTRTPWGYVHGIRSPRSPGAYSENCAVVWRRDKAQLGDGAIGNLALPGNRSRTAPFVVAMRSGNLDFTLVVVHTRWSNTEDGTRRQEIEELTTNVKYLRGMLVDRDTILLGDFNYKGSGTILAGMARSLGMTQVDPDQPTTFAADASGYANAYDHVFLDTEATREYTDGDCIVVDPSLVYGPIGDKTRAKARTNLSDHLPVMLRLCTSAPDDD